MAHSEMYNPSFGKLGIEVSKRWPEWDAVLAKRAQRKAKDTLGVALSGGGYRSAIFCYGVLRGLHKLGVLSQADYLSVVSGGSWIGMAYATTNYLADYFFVRHPDKPNFIEEGFESFLANPVRLAQELAMTRPMSNYVSDLFGRVLAGTFLREHGQDARFKLLDGGGLVKDGDRPFLIVNGTVNWRPVGKFEIVQECFEMTRLYTGSRTLGYMPTSEVPALDKPLRVRDAIAVSGAAVAVHVPGVGDEVHGAGLSREVKNFARGLASNAPSTEALDVADGGHYNNLGVESLINRGCGFLIIVDAEHDPESPKNGRSNQKYEGLLTLLRRNHIRMAFGNDPSVVIRQLDELDKPVHVFRGDESIPDVLYIKLKSWSRFDDRFKDEPYNQPGFVRNLFGRGAFHFDPQFSTAKLDYEFPEHRNLSDLGEFVVEQHAAEIQGFARLAT